MTNYGVARRGVARPRGARSPASAPSVRPSSVRRPPGSAYRSTHSAEVRGRYARPIPIGKRGGKAVWGVGRGPVVGRVADIRPDYRNNSQQERGREADHVSNSSGVHVCWFYSWRFPEKKEALAVAARAVVRCPWSVGRLPLALRLRVGRTPDRGRPHGKTFLVSTIPSSYRVVCAKQCCSVPISAVVPPMSLSSGSRTPTRQVE